MEKEPSITLKEYTGLQSICTFTEKSLLVDIKLLDGVPYSALVEHKLYKKNNKKMHKIKNPVVLTLYPQGDFSCPVEMWSRLRDEVPLSFAVSLNFGSLLWLDELVKITHNDESEIEKEQELKFKHGLFPIIRKNIENATITFLNPGIGVSEALFNYIFDEICTVHKSRFTSPLWLNIRIGESESERLKGLTLLFDQFEFWFAVLAEVPINTVQQTKNAIQLIKLHLASHMIDLLAKKSQENGIDKSFTELCSFYSFAESSNKGDLAMKIFRKHAMLDTYYLCSLRYADILNVLSKSSDFKRWEEFLAGVSFFTYVSNMANQSSAASEFKKQITIGVHDAYKVLCKFGMENLGILIKEYVHYMTEGITMEFVDEFYKSLDDVFKKFEVPAEVNNS